MGATTARTDSSTGTRARRGGAATRRRGAALVDALLRAAWDEVSAVGYANLTMEGVAARAGTAKSVLYRRWPNRAALVRDAMRRRVGSVAAEPLPDTGDLREDLLAVLRRFRDRYRQIGPDVAHGLMSEYADLPPEVYSILPDIIMAILNRSAARGEVRLDKVTPRIAALPGDLLRHELMLTRGNAGDDVLAEIVDEIFLPLVAARSRTPDANADRAAGRSTRG